MNVLKNRNSLFALFLVLSFAVSLFAVFPNANAQVKISVPDRETGAFISTNPDLIGASQPLLVNLWVYPSPTGPQIEMGTGITGINDPTHIFQGIHYNNISVTFTRPDGSKDTFMPLDGSASSLGLIAGQTEEVGTMWFIYHPTQTGTWSVSFSFPGQSYTYLNWTVYYKPSTSRSITFTVQQDPVQIGLPPVQLPTGYWERPINAQNREWSEISGDWIPRYNTVPSNNGIGGGNFYSKAPNSTHIVWQQGLSLGGLTGGEWGGLSYSAGGSAQIIISGRLYYTVTTPSGTQTVCRNLRTGELIWMYPGTISDGQIEAPGSSNVAEFAGSPVPYLWTFSGTTGWVRYNAYTFALSRNITTNISNLGGPQWESDNIAYTLRQGAWSGTTFRRAFNFLLKWNLSKVTGNNLLTGLVWNTTLKQPDGTGPGEGSRASGLNIFPDINLAVVNTIADPKYYGYDLTTGALRWIHDIGFPAEYFFFTRDGYLIAQDSSNMKFVCWDLRNWNQLWSNVVGEWPWGSQAPRVTFGYGNMYSGTYDGYERCIDVLTGEQEWAYYVGNTTETPFGTWAIYNGKIVADGKEYIYTTEHTPTQPRTRGNKLVCLDAFTGEHLWNVSGPLAPRAVADGYLISAADENSGVMYCFGKGKTETTVTAPLTAIPLHQSLMLQGTVMDMSPASAGTAAISDEDMGPWMNYLYFGAAEPMTSPDGDSWGTPVDVKGVEVSLDAIDPNNNFVHIGTATSDRSGLYGLPFTPEVPGVYKIIATFAGSESYWASYAETYVNVEEAHAATPPAEEVPTDLMPVYTAVIGAAIAIIIAIAIAVVLILRKKP